MIPSEIKRLMRTNIYDIKSRANKLLSADLCNVDSSSVDRRVGVLMDGYMTRKLAVHFNGCFRARKNDGSALFVNSSELWYPKPHHVTRRGRFNEAGQPVFYACTRGRGAIFEVHPNPGDYITLMTARSSKTSIEAECAHVGLARSSAEELRILRKTNILKDDPGFRANLDRLGVFNKWLAVDDFISDASTSSFLPNQEEDKYKITNSISRILFRMPGIDILNYPSVATKLNCINLCVRPEAADVMFAPSEAWFIRVTGTVSQLPGVPGVGTYYGVQFLRKTTNIDPDGSLHWGPELSRQPEPHEVAYLS